MAKVEDIMGLDEGPALRGRISDLEDALLSDSQNDPRMSNGAAGGAPLDDMVFIQMSGLAPPVPRKIGAAADTLDTEAPLSFYEKGIEDVDDEAVPYTNKDGFDPDDGVIEYSPRSTRIARSEPVAVTNLKEIIADLTQGSVDEADACETEDEEYDTPREGPNSDSLFAPEEVTPAGLVTPYNESTDDLTGAIADVTPAGLVGPFDREFHGRSFVAPRTDRKDPNTYREGHLPAAAPTRTQEPAQMPGERVEVEGLDQDTEALRRQMEENAHDPWEDPPRGEHWDDPFDATADSGGRSRHRRGVSEHGSRAVLRRARILVVNLLVGAAIVTGIVFGIRTYQAKTATEAEAYGLAERDMRLGRFESASAAFEDFAARFPNDPQSPQAQFMAAQALFSVPDGPKDATQRAHERSLELFDKYLAQNHQHPKAARAETMRAILFYRLGRFDEAVHLLQNPDRLSADPEAKLPSLRTLARSYAALGRIEEAASTYLRAASIESNPAADEDYIELAELYRSLAERQPDGDLRRRYEELTRQQWQFASRVPALPPARERAIRRLLENEAVSEGTNAPTEIEAPAEIKALPSLADDESVGVSPDAETRVGPENTGETHETP